MREIPRLTLYIVVDLAVNIPTPLQEVKGNFRLVGQFAWQPLAGWDESLRDEVGYLVQQLQDCWKKAVFLCSSLSEKMFRLPG